jgi:hypothetical protein
VYRGTGVVHLYRGTGVVHLYRGSGVLQRFICCIGIQKLYNDTEVVQWHRNSPRIQGPEI